MSLNVKEQRLYELSTQLFLHHSDPVRWSAFWSHTPPTHHHLQKSRKEIPTRLPPASGYAWKFCPKIYEQNWWQRAAVPESNSRNAGHAHTAPALVTRLGCERHGSSWNWGFDYRPKPALQYPGVDLPREAVNPPAVPTQSPAPLFKKRYHQPGLPHPETLSLTSW